MAEWIETTAAKAFNERPEPPYIEGDVWSQGPSGEAMRCVCARTASEVFDPSDWEPASGAKTRYGSCETAGPDAEKEAAIDDGAFSLRSGSSVAVRFAHANTAASPTLDVGGTGAFPIRLNGGSSAYWADGATVAFVFDGSCWQVCSTPLYGSTATVGNPAAGNVYIDGGGVNLRVGDRTLSSFSDSGVNIGSWADSTMAGDTSELTFYGGSGSMSFTVGETRDSMEIASGDIRLSSSASSVILSAGDVNLTGEVKVNGEGVGDFVIESGSDGIWTYFRYSSGFAICSGKTSLTQSCTGSLGAVYYGSNFGSGLAFPFRFAAAPSVFFSGSMASNGLGWIVPYAITAEKTSWTAFSATSATLTFDANILVVGRWR